MDSSAPPVDPAEAVRPSRPVLGPILIAVVVLVVAFMAVFLRVAPQKTSLAADSPEAAYQGYYEALDRGAGEAAYTYLSRSAQRRMPRCAFFEALGWSGEGSERRVWVAMASQTGDRAELDLTVESPAGGFFGNDPYREERRVPMAREGGVWKIDEPQAGLYAWYGEGDPKC